jgi:hypothetical protein
LTVHFNGTPVAVDLGGRITRRKSSNVKKTVCAKVRITRAGTIAGRFALCGQCCERPGGRRPLLGPVIAGGADEPIDRGIGGRGVGDVKWCFVRCEPLAQTRLDRLDRRNLTSALRRPG